jgi:1-acyl-sn-glycerol-3-phosphate acyltransferase
VIAVLRSLLYAVIFYTATFLWVVVGVPVSLLGRKATLAIVLSWVDFHHWLARLVLGIEVRIEGDIPPGPRLIAVKHQAMFETLEMVRITHLPIIVLKKELSDIPLFGLLTRRYGVIPVERSAGSKALRALVEQGRRAIATGRPVMIYPEGTRVRVGECPAPKPGFAALYRALDLPVTPVAVDSGKLWGRGLVHKSGTITFRVGESIPAGLGRKEIEERVHSAINWFELGPQSRT